MALSSPQTFACVKNSGSDFLHPDHNLHEMREKVGLEKRHQSSARRSWATSRLICDRGSGTQDAVRSLCGTWWFYILWEECGLPTAPDEASNAGSFLTRAFIEICAFHCLRWKGQQDSLARRLRTATCRLTVRRRKGIWRPNSERNCLYECAVVIVSGAASLFQWSRLMCFP